MTVVVQLGFAIVPRWRRTSSALISGITSGTWASIRNAEDLSIAIASAWHAIGTYFLETAPSVQKNAMSILSNDRSASFSMGTDSPRNRTDFPAERAEARGRKFATGKFRRSSTRN